MLQLSYSAISQYQACPRKYAYDRVLGYRPVGAEPRSLGFGKAFHAAQQVWWLGRHDDDPAVRLQAARVTFAEHARELSLEDQILGDILLTGYAARWADQGLMFHMEPVVEQRVVAPILSPDGVFPDAELVGVFDVTAYDTDGTGVMVEHKTTTSALDDGSKFWSRWDRSLQVSLYYILAHDSGRTLGRFTLDAVRAPEMHLKKATPPEHREFYVRGNKTTGAKPGDPKPGTRLQDEDPNEFAAYVQESVLSNPDAFFARRSVPRTPDDLERTRADLYTVAKSIVHSREHDLYPRNEQSCALYNRPCEYVPVCWGGESIENPRLYQLRVRNPFDK